MTRILQLLLLLLLLALTAVAEDEPIELQKPVGLFVDGFNDTTSTCFASLACLYMKMKGYDPVNLNDSWKDERKLHQKRAIRKRASRLGIKSLIYLYMKPPDKSITYHLFKWSWRSTARLKLKENLFQVNVDVDIHIDAHSKRPDFSVEFNQGVHTYTELDFKGGEDYSLHHFEPAMRLIGFAIDSLLGVLPVQTDTTVAKCIAIPTTIVCDRKFKQHYGDEWTREMAKQIYMANVVLVDNLDVALYVKANMLYDVPREVESFGDLLSHLQTETLNIPDGIAIFFTGYNLDFENKRFFSLEALGLSPLVGRRTIIASTPDTIPSSDPWDYLYEGLVVAHEVGHLFGAVHTDDHSSIMYPVANVVVPRFDKPNKERIKRVLPLIVGQDCFVDSLSYPELVGTLLVMYPDTIDCIKALNSILYDFSQGKRLVHETPDLASDYLYSLASGIQLLKYGMEDAARGKFVDALSKGPEQAEVLFWTGQLYLDADSVETGCSYIERARAAGLDLPPLRRCLEYEESSDSVSESE